MAENFEHLELPLVPETYERRKREQGGGGYEPRPGDRRDFFDVQVQEFANIKGKYDRDKEWYRPYLDPNLIFKIEINQSVDEETFRQELRRMNMEVLAPSPDKKDKNGYWVVFAEDEDLKRFKEKLKLYAEEERYKFFHAIDGIAEIPPEEKIGERLKEEDIRHDETA